MDNSEARKKLSSPNPKIAEQAFAHLLPIMRQIAFACVRSYDLQEADVQDLISITCLCFWQRHEQFEDKGEGAFRAYIRKLTDWTCLDRIKKIKNQTETVPLDDLEIDAGERELITTVDILDQAGRLASCCDTVLLGLDRNLSPETHTRKLLAAQLFYLEEASHREILRLLPSSPVDEIQLTPTNLDSWLSDPAVLRHLVYQCLCDIYSQSSVTTSPIAAKAAMLKLTADFKSFDRAYNIDRDAVFCTDGIWHRLVFQLWYVAKWSQPEILRHIGEIATGVGYTKITPDNLNVWLSAKRLRNRCLKYIEETWGGSLP